MTLIYRYCRLFVGLHIVRPLLRLFSSHTRLVLFPVLMLVHAVGPIDARAATDCMASVFARTTSIPSIDMDTAGPASVPRCSANITFSNVSSGALTAVSGSAVATGGGGTMSNTGVVTLPAAEAVGQLAVNYSLTGFGNYALSRADARFTYQFKLVSTGTPPPAGTTHVPVLFTYAWAAEITGTGPGNASTIFFQHTLGTGGRDMLRQGINANINNIPPVLGDISQACSDGTIGGPGSCDTAKLGFLNNSPFPVLIHVNAVGQDFDIELVASSIARLNISNGLTGSSTARARAFIDPVIEIRNDFKPYFSIEYGQGSFRLITTPPDTGNAGALLPVLQLLLE